MHVLNGHVYVAYALRSTTTPYRSVNAVGDGVVDEFDGNGNFIARIATGGNLDAPWGVAIAPAGFGIFGGDILIGNFGNGMINAYDPNSFAYLGQLTDGTGKPLVYSSLWELLPGGTAVTNTTAVSGGTVGTVYFTAGLAGEQHGLLGAIANSAPSGTPAFGFSASAGALTMTAGSSGSATLSVAPTNNFTGTVAFACSGLPAGAVCSFSSAQVTATGAAPSTAMLTIQTTKVADSGFRTGAGIVLAVLLPFGGLLVRRRRLPYSLRSAALFGVLLAGAASILGCSSGKAANPVTPPGTSQVTIMATSGSISQSTTISLTVQ